MKFEFLNSSTFYTRIEEAEIEVGNLESMFFEPHLKLKRWGGECFCKVSYPTIKKIIPLQEGGKVKWQDEDKEIHFYSLESTKQYENGGFEIEIILKKKPPRNIITLNTETQGLDFYYQPPLTEEEIPPEGGSVTETEVKDKKGRIIKYRPENIVGSYAVYHKTKKGNYSKIGGQNYKAGKAFHIFRPKITDANGDVIWGILNINEKKGTLTITIDQNYLNNAVYPVRIDPTFGETVKGGSSYRLTNYLAADEATLTENGTATKLTIYFTNTDASNAHNARAGLYDEGADDKAEDRLQDSGDVSIAASYDDWKDFDITDEALTSADYWLILHTSNSLLDMWYDSGGRHQETLQTYGALPAIFPDVGVSAYTISIYCTYTTGAALSIPVAMRHYRNMRES